MTSKNKLAAAALAGLFTATVLSAAPAYAGDEDKSGCNDKEKAQMEKSNCKTADGKEKHACKGQNSCAGQGSDGKNSCKGKGSCATDGSK
jgi:hypothetical protein